MRVRVLSRDVARVDSEVHSNVVRMRVAFWSVVSTLTCVTLVLTRDTEHDCALLLQRLFAADAAPLARQATDDAGACGHHSCCSPRADSLLASRVRTRVTALWRQLEERHALPSSASRVSEALHVLMVADARPALNASTAVHRVRRLLAELWTAVSEQRSPPDASVAAVERLMGEFFVDAVGRRYASHAFAPQYVACVLDVWNSEHASRPQFATVARTLARDLQRTLDIVAVLLRALSVARQAVHMSATFAPDDHCVARLTRVLHCGSCFPGAPRPACRDACLSAFEQCFENVSALDSAWQQFVSAFSQLASAAVGDRNPQTLLQSVMASAEHAERVLRDHNTRDTTRKVRVACGHPKRYVRHVSNDTDAEPWSAVSAEPQTSFYVVLQTFAHQLWTARHFFAERPLALCGEHVAVDGQCWNGSELWSGRASEHASNVSHVLSADLVAISDRLQSLSGVQSDQRVADGSGSGHFDADDEDYADEHVDDDASGAGSGQRGSTASAVDDGFVFSEDTRRRAESADKSGRESRTRHSSLKLLTICAILVVLNCDIVIINTCS